MYATIADVEIDYGTIPEAQTERVEALIERAEAFILSEVPNLVARISDGRTLVPLLRQVVGELVAERLRNPQGLRSFAHTEGPFTTSGTYADGWGGTAGLSARHLRLLGVTASGAWTIHPGRSR